MENFKFKKEFGQNFIYDEDLLSDIIKLSNITKEDNVLEIGAGCGNLTKKIAQNCKFVLSYEIDKKLTEHLKNLEIQYNNLKIIIKDILKESTKDIENQFKNDFVIVANLPYYITSPIIFKFLEESNKVKNMTFMVQKEVAERFVAKENSKQYGVSTIMINYRADVKYLRTVSKNMFHPSPKVDSALIQITPNYQKKLPKNDEFFKMLVKTAFSSRRKTLVNNLEKLIHDKNAIKQSLKILSLNENIRAENISIEQFVLLSDYLTELNKIHL